VTTIYHGTPLTPRDALVSVCAGRAMCVSFYRPDDVEVVEAVAPAIMFRQRRVFVLAVRASSRRGMGRASGLDTLFRVAGAAPVPSGSLGGHPRYAGRALPAQRCAFGRVAVRTEGRTTLAHGWADRTAAAPVRAIRPGLPGLDRPQSGFARLSRSHGRGGPRFGQSLAGDSHDARNGGGFRIPVRQRRQHEPSAERVAL